LAVQPPRARRPGRPDRRPASRSQTGPGGSSTRAPPNAPPRAVPVRRAPCPRGFGPCSSTRCRSAGAAQPPRTVDGTQPQVTPESGYGQAGMLRAVAAVLKDKPRPTDADIDGSITNICRGGTFQQVREAIHAAAKA